MLELTKEKAIDLLTSTDLWDGSDELLANTSGDLWEMVILQTHGRYFFAKNKVIFISGYGTNRFAIPYKDIVEIKKTFVGPFMPFGINVTYVDQATGKNCKKKFSLLSRDKWISLMEEGRAASRNAA